MAEAGALEGFTERLKELIGDQPVGRFAAEVGLGDNLVRKYLGGATPGLDKFVQICNAKGVNPEWLAWGRGPKYLVEGAYTHEPPGEHPAREPGSSELIESSDGREYVKVPQYDVRASAGRGELIHSEQIVDHIAFEREWFEREVGIPAAHAAVLEVRGDSMVPDLHDGELLIMDLSKNRFVDDAIYVIQYGNALRIKKVRVRLDGKIEIRSSNDAYAPEIVEPDDAASIVVVGRGKTAVPKVRRLS